MKVYAKDNVKQYDNIPVTYMHSPSWRRAKAEWQWNRKEAAIMFAVCFVIWFAIWALS